MELAAGLLGLLGAAAMMLIAVLKGKYVGVLAVVVLYVLAVVPLAAPDANTASKGFGGLLYIALTIVIGAFAVRLAKPGSWWASRRYDPVKRERALGRYVDSSLATEAMRGSSHPLATEDPWVCSACDRHFPDQEAALRHADNFHTELRFDDAKAALRRC